MLTYDSILFHIFLQDLSRDSYHENAKLTSSNTRICCLLLHAQNNCCCCLPACIIVFVTSDSILYDSSNSQHNLVVEDVNSAFSLYPSLARYFRKTWNAMQNNMHSMSAYNSVSCTQAMLHFLFCYCCYSS